MSAEVGASLPTAGMTAIQCIRNVAGASLDGSYKGDMLARDACMQIHSFIHEDSAKTNQRLQVGHEQTLIPRRF